MQAKITKTEEGNWRPITIEIVVESLEDANFLYKIAHKKAVMGTPADGGIHPLAVAEPLKTILGEELEKQGFKPPFVDMQSIIF